MRSFSKLFQCRIVLVINLQLFATRGGVAGYSGVRVVLGTKRWLSRSSTARLNREGKRSAENIKEYTMRATYEAYILVKIKDGSQYVCALNRPPKRPDNLPPASLQEQLHYLATKVIWN